MQQPVINPDNFINCLQDYNDKKILYSKLSSITQTIQAVVILLPNLSKVLACPKTNDACYDNNIYFFQSTPTTLI